MESKSVHLLSAGANSARHEHEERDEGRPRCETSGRMCAFSLALLKEKVFVSRRRSGLHAAGEPSERAMKIEKKKVVEISRTGAARSAPRRSAKRKINTRRAHAPGEGRARSSPHRSYANGPKERFRSNLVIGDVVRSSRVSIVLLYKLFPKKRIAILHCSMALSCSMYRVPRRSTRRLF